MEDNHSNKNTLPNKKPEFYALVLESIGILDQDHNKIKDQIEKLNMIIQNMQKKITELEKIVQLCDQKWDNLE
jgi:hypothetical protein